ncbi:MAG: hydrogenase maturation protease [Firmicutes bacterium]|nr:hydrogenase maturation protease [Bacillota bacterium]
MKVLIIGLGNPLFCDDGIGPRVVQELKKRPVPSAVQPVEAGGSFFNYWSFLLQSHHVIAVDSMLGGGPAGTVYRVGPGCIGEDEKYGIRHEVHFRDVLKMAAFHGARPGVIILGVEPKNLDYSLQLSPEIEEKVPELVKIILTYCRNPIDASCDGWGG